MSKNFANAVSCVPLNFQKTGKYRHLPVLLQTYSEWKFTWLSSCDKQKRLSQYNSLITIHKYLILSHQNGFNVELKDRQLKQEFQHTRHLTCGKIRHWGLL